MTVQSESCMGDDGWPPGFRFHPTDEELVLYYLKRRICRRKLKLDIIAEVDVYKWDPEELPGQSILKSGDRQWFYFTPRDRKYPNGGRSNRATRHGYWKATGKDRNIMCNSRTVGVKKTLVFYRGRAPHGERTDWVMHEYTLDEEELKRCQNVQDYYALYKLYKKSGPGPKNGEQYGAPFKEEEWDDVECPDFNNSVDRDISVKQLNEVTSLANVRANGQVFDGFEEFMRQIADDPVLEQPQLGDCALTLSQVVGEEETQSTMVDPASTEVMNAVPVGVLHPSGQLYDVQPSFGLTQSATSQLQLYESPEVLSAPNLHGHEPFIIHEEDFLEIDDLIGPEPSFSNDRAVENLQFENRNGDGLSEFEVFHDAALFLHDMGPIDQATVADPYINTLENNTVTQFDYQLQPNLDGAGQNNDQLWALDERRNLYTSAESDLGYFPTPSGVGYESTNYHTQANQNENGNEDVGAYTNYPIHANQNENGNEDVGAYTNYPIHANQNENGNEDVGAASRFSSALWSFVESIPTTPASASENALVNRAFERMSSFSRVRMNVKNTNVSVGNGAESNKRAGRSKGLFFISVIGVLCAMLWVLIGNVRLWGRCMSS